MKKFNLLIGILILTIGLFTSCEKSDSSDNIIVQGNALIANYGSYSGAKGEFSLYNEGNGAITNNYYNTKNTPLEFTSCIQSIYKHNGKIYSMSNNADKIDIMDLTTFKGENPIETDIVKPRYMVAKEDKAYVSCWGNVSDWKVMANSYIAIINLNTKNVTKIPHSGGSEGLAIVDNKLYAASYTKNSIAVFDLATEKFERNIQIPALARHFIVNGKTLWVSHVSSYSIPYTKDKLGITAINTTNNSIIKTINIEGIGSEGYFASNLDGSKIYVLGAEPWPSTVTNITSVNTKDNTINEKFITGESFNGIGYNQTTDKLYVLISPSTSSNGKVQIYNTKGEKLKEATTGISPMHVIFY